MRSPLDALGVMRISVPEGLAPIASIVMKDVSEAEKSRTVTFLDFQRNEHNQRIYLPIVVPIFDEVDGRPLGTVILRIDPETYLYPFINRWPTPSETAETLLVRRDGSNVLFLNELRFEKNTALNMQISLDKTDTPAVAAVLGREGVMNGIDYRGMPVVAATQSIPDSPWFLVARIDTAEIYAPLWRQLWQIILLVSVLLLGLMAGLFMLWRQQNLRFYQARYDSEEAQRASEVRYRRLFEAAKDGILILDAETAEVVDVNPFLTETLGYSSEQIVGKKVWELGFLKDIVASQANFLELQQREYVRYEDLPMETVDGRQIDMEFVSNVYLVNGRRVIQCNIRDISERKQEAARLERMGRILSEGQKIAHYGSWEYLVETQETIWSDEEFRIYGSEPGAQSPVYAIMLKESIHPDDRGLLDTTFQACLQSGSIFELEHRIVRPDGSVRFLYDIANPYFDASGKIASYVGTTLDITERKQAESLLRERVAELQRWQNATLGRENRVLELKHEVNELLAKAGQPPHYPSPESLDGKEK
jgi:PAS domain S-box-containing protein